MKSQNILVIFYSFLGFAQTSADHKVIQRLNSNIESIPDILNGRPHLPCNPEQEELSIAPTQNFTLPTKEQFKQTILNLNENRNHLWQYANCLGPKLPGPVFVDHSKNMRQGQDPQRDIFQGYVYYGAAGIKPKIAEMFNSLDVTQKWAKDRRFNNLYQQITDLKKFDKESDLGLILAIAYRESSTASLSSSPEQTSSYMGGGLDNIGNYINDIKNNYLPPGYGDKWQPYEKSQENEGGFLIRPAMLPKKELIMAYGAWLNRTRDKFYETAKEFGFSKKDVDKLTPEARRFWMALHFAGPGGLPYNKFEARGRPARLLGARTILSQMKQRIEKGKANSLNDISFLATDYKNFKRINIALATALNATIMSDQLQIAPPSQVGKECEKEAHKIKSTL